MIQNKWLLYCFCQTPHWVNPSKFWKQISKAKAIQQSHDSSMGCNIMALHTALFYYTTELTYQSSFSDCRQKTESALRCIWDISLPVLHISSVLEWWKVLPALQMSPIGIDKVNCNCISSCPKLFICPGMLILAFSTCCFVSFQHHWLLASFSECLVAQRLIYS